MIIRNDVGVLTRMRKVKLDKTFKSNNGFVIFVVQCRIKLRPASSLVLSLGKALNGTPHLYVEDRWPRHFGNSNSQASADIPSEI